MIKKRATLDSTTAYVEPEWPRSLYGSEQMRVGRTEWFYFQKYHFIWGCSRLA